MTSDSGRNGSGFPVEEVLERVDWLLEEGEPGEARRLCRRAIRGHPRDERIWIAYGDSLAEEGRHAEALRAYERGSELAPGWALALAKRAEALLEIGRTREAEEAVEEALALHRDDSHATFIRAMVFEFLGRDEAADFWYRRAARLDGENYFRPYRPAWDRFQEGALAALAMLPSEQQETLGAHRLRVRDLPSRASRGRSSALRMCDVLPPRPRSGGRPLVYLYRRNLERVCRDQEELVEQIYLTLLNELEPPPGLSS
ncbi:MAG: tetratricopeptide repeat protein [Deltaproteobacteria bacterium]|nr:tetratricopeptide repeat protein [Deltaproteobacteria bacterium]